ncbi:MAG: T9SS C-terminal target domain-containing protein [Bacteroidetes bacterium]|nr:MAG: T9SS C-terminal target domain-containing protein [Bacteroidota bacterium]
MPVLQIHGTADTTVPYEGNSTFTIAIDSAITFWVNYNGCNATPRYREIPNTNITDLSTVDQFTYNECADDSEVMLLRVNGGSHTWPGSPVPFPGTNYDINASEEIWRFFQRFTREIIIRSTSAQKVDLTVRVFPNPGQGIITIEGMETDAPYQLKVFNSFGQLVQQAYTTDSTVDLSTIPAGTYFLHIQQANQVGWSKWVKTK